RRTSDTRASSPSSRSWKIAACFNRLRFTARSYDAPEGGASETVGDAGGSAYRPSPSARGGVSIRARCGLAAGDRGCGRRVGFLRRDAGASLRRVAHGGRARSGCRQVLYGGGLPDRRAQWLVVSSRDFVV